MENKLTLREVSPYLPYGLKMAHLDSQFKNGFEVHVLNGLSENYRYREEDLDEDDDKELLIIKEITFWFNHSGLNSTAHNIKPILRPLSDLFNLIDWDNNNDPYMIGYKYGVEKVKEGGVEFYANEYDAEYAQSPKCYIDITSFNLWLFEKHFDIFGLIEKGLAIDINKLAKTK